MLADALNGYPKTRLAAKKAKYTQVNRLASKKRRPTRRQSAAMQGFQITWAADSDLRSYLYASRDRIQTWHVSVRDYEHPIDGLVASVTIHRMRHGSSAMWLEEKGYLDSSDALSDVLGKDDRLRPRVLRIMGEPNRAGDEDASLLVVERIALADQWHRVRGAAELILATAIAGIVETSDCAAIAQPVPPGFVGRARTAPLSVNVPVFEKIGFRKYSSNAWVLTEVQAAVHSSAIELSDLFGIEVEHASTNLTRKNARA